MTFWETFWATFAGGFAASLVAILGIVIVEVVRAKQEAGREKRAAVERRLARRRASRNAAKSVLMELFEASRPLERFVAGLAGWEPMHVRHDSWDNQATRAALVDLMTDEALFNVEHAYHELSAIEKRIGEGRGFLTELAQDDGTLGKKLLAMHVQPAMDDLHMTIAAVETLELAAEGQLAAEAAKLRREGGES